MTTATALSIAGSDPSGGAGIQADLKSFAAHRVYGMAAVTLLTAQNTQGVRGMRMVEPAFVAAQIAAVLDDIPPGAVKIGALGSAEIVVAVADALAGYAGPVVLDPVMVAKSGDPLLADEAVAAVLERLVPRAALVTPNLPEAAKLAGGETARTDAEIAAQGVAILERGAGAVLMKGGHATGPQSVDVLMRAGSPDRLLPAPRIETPNTHGTGCTLSSAIAARLARGDGLDDAVTAAKDWLQGAIGGADDLGIGQGRGPLHHFHAMW